jgi:hypothetical protein
MIIQEVLNLLSSQLTALGWVDLFGGVTQRITVAMPNASDGVTYKSFPVSCSVTQAECNQDQRYKELTPDSGKKSVLYWEVTRGLQDAGASRDMQKVRILTGSARLVGWLNTMKLGVNECNTAAKAMRSILPILYQTFNNGGSNALLQKGEIRFEFAGEEIKDKAIFDRYDYGNNTDGFLLYPYDFFAMNVNIVVKLPLCDYTFTTGTEINCIDNSQL